MDGYRTNRSRKRFYELTPFEKALLGRIFQAILESGKAPSVTVLHRALHTYRLRIVRTLGKLEQKRRLVREKETGQIVSVYPVSLLPTEHRVILEGGETFFAKPAVDALGIPHVFNKSAEIMSPCHVCHTTITITVEKGSIKSTSHPRICFWSPKQRERSAAVAYSQFMNFFCSQEHIDAWMRENAQLANKGQIRHLEQEYPHIRDHWTRYGKMIGLG